MEAERGWSPAPRDQNQIWTGSQASRSDALVRNLAVVAKDPRLCPHSSIKLLAATRGLPGLCSSVCRISSLTLLVSMTACARPSASGTQLRKPTGTGQACSATGFKDGRHYRAVSLPPLGDRCLRSEHPERRSTPEQ